MNNAPSTLIEQAMQRSGQIARQAAEDHWHAFTAQMQERVGVEKITLDEPYLPFLLARSELRYLYRMARLEQRLIDEKSSDCCAEHKDDPMPMGAQIERETNRAIIETKQALDAARQQSFGIGEYVWQGGECSECAPKDGQTFSWGEGEVPGSVHPNCNCSASPILEGAGDPNPPEVTPEDIAEAALLLASLIPVVGAWSRGLAVVRSLGSVGRRILERVGRNEETPVEPSTAKPKPDISQRPEGVPEEWSQIPSKRGEGIRYRDPKNQHNEVRIQKGKPEVSNPSQQRDYVRWKKNGQWLDKNGKPSTDPVQNHIPLDEFDFNPEIFK